MSVSHWGFFPGWFEPEFVPGCGYPIGGTRRAVWMPADWDQFWQIMAAVERLK